MAKRDQERQVTLTAQLRDQMSRGLQSLRTALRGTEEQSARTAQSGTALGRMFRSVQSNASSAARVIGTTFRTGLNVVATAIGSVIRALTSLQAIILVLVTGFVANRVRRFIIDTANAMDRLATDAQRVQIAVAELQTLQFVAEQAGVSIGNLAGTIQRAQRRIDRFARTGAGPAANALRRMNVQLTDAEGRVRSISELLPEFAESLQRMEHGEQLQALFEIFGREGQDLILLMRQAPEEIQRLIDRAQELGVMTERQGFIAGRLTSSLTQLQFAWDAVKRAALEAIGPDVTDQIDKLTDLIASMRERVGNFLAAMVQSFRDSDIRQIFIELLEQVLIEALRLVPLIVQEIALLVIEALRVIVPGMARPLIAIFANLIFQVISEAVQIAFEQLSRVGGRVGQFFAEMAFTQELMQDIATDLSRRAAQTGMDGGQFQTFARQVGDSANFIKQEVKDSFEVVLPILERFNEAGRKSFETWMATRKAITPPEEAATAWEQFFNGVKNGFEEMRKNMRDLGEEGKAVAQRIGQAFTDDLADVFVDVVSGVQSMGEAFRRFAASVLTDMARIIARATLMRIMFGGAGMPGGGLFGFLGFNAGGEVQELNSGGQVTGGSAANVDSVPALLTRGEHVIQRPAVEYYGSGWFDALNRMLVPRSLVSGHAVTAKAASYGRTRFNTGGAVGGGNAGPQILPVQVTDETNMDRLINGGRNALLRFMQDNAGEIRTSLGT